jgi:orotate phosphoribosyltransferase
MHSPFLIQKSELIIELYNIGAIKFGEFTLKSGTVSPIYIDLRQIISYPAILRMVSECLWEMVCRCRFDLICGIPYTALPIATCMSLQQHIPMIMRRKEKKPYGTQQQIEGVFKAGQTCLLIEDVITSGGSVSETADDLENNGLLIKDIAVLIDREQGGKTNLQARQYIVHAALTLSEILMNLLDSNILPEAERTIVNQLLREHIV